MWESTLTAPPTVRLSHDLPCQSCGHGVHTFLPCGDSCSCPPVVMPGEAA